jgi:hypothetical protein
MSRRNRIETKPSSLIPHLDQKQLSNVKRNIGIEPFKPKQNLDKAKPVKIEIKTRSLYLLDDEYDTLTYKNVKSP